MRAGSARCRARRRPRDVGARRRGAARACADDPGARARGDRLHVGHVGAPQGRDADAREPAVRRRDVRRRCATSTPTTACSARCRSTTSTGSPRCCSAASPAARACTRSRASTRSARSTRSRTTASRSSRACPRCTRGMLERLPEGTRVVRAARCATSMRAARRSTRSSRRTSSGASAARCTTATGSPSARRPCRRRGSGAPRDGHVGRPAGSRGVELSHRAVGRAVGARAERDEGLLPRSGGDRRSDHAGRVARRPATSRASATTARCSSSGGRRS